MDREELTRLPYSVRRVRDLQRIIQEIEETGTANASITSGGGSRSYTRLDLDTLYRALRYWMKRVYGSSGIRMVKPCFGEVR